MIVKSKPFPQIRAEERSSLVMLDTAIALFPPFFMAVFYYGIRSLALGALTVLAALVTNWISSLLEINSFQINIFIKFMWIQNSLNIFYKF